jgi:hypothetical protein
VCVKRATFNHAQPIQQLNSDSPIRLVKKLDNVFWKTCDYRIRHSLIRQQSEDIYCLSVMLAYYILSHDNWVPVTTALHVHRFWMEKTLEYGE